MFFLVTRTLAQRIYILNHKEINKHAANAMEPGFKCFVVYKNGDTLKGEDFKKKHNKITGKVVWTLDDKELDLDKIHSYQDENAYRVGAYYYMGGGNWSAPEYVRVVRGEICLYLVQQIERRPTRVRFDHKNIPTVSHQLDLTHTSFVLKTPEWGFIPTTPTALEVLVKDDPLALAELHKLFPKMSGKATSDYRAVIKILEIFNKE